MIRFGTNPIAWSNDDDRTLGSDITLEQCLSQASQIGFDGIENGHKFPQDPVELTTALKRHGLVFVSAWYSMQLLDRSLEAEKAALQPHLDRLKAMGCKICIVCETSNAVYSEHSKPISEKPALTTCEWAHFGARLEEIATYCLDQDLTLAYHHHIGTIVQAPEEIDLLMAHTGPATGLLFDTGHCYFGGGDPAVVLKRHIGRVVHFHAKNVRSEILRQVCKKDLSFLGAVRRGVFTVPGDPEGDVDFPACLRILADQNYDGWLVIEAEQDPAIRNPAEYQSLGLSSLTSMAATMGFTE